MTVFAKSVAIDTNVFLHLLNPQKNTCSHINGLLEALQARDTVLLVDDRQRIQGEYSNQISPTIART